jgi:hypothetical protein
LAACKLLQNAWKRVESTNKEDATMSDETDYIAEALTQKLEEREYDFEGSWIFPMLTREDSVELLEQLCSEVGLTEFEYPAHTHDVLMLAKELKYKVSAHTPSYYAP